MVVLQERGPVAGVVLAGGLSRRMGKDKALERLAGPTGSTSEDMAGGNDGSMLARVHCLVRSLVPVCFVSCRADTPRQGYDCVFDAVRGVGPTAGLQAALRQAEDMGFAAVLALSCDLPFMDASTLRKLLAARNEAPATSLVTAYRERHTGRIESLVAVYEVGALPYFDRALVQGQRRIASVIPQEFQCLLDYGPEEAAPFFNCNSPEDLALAQARLS
ncbi:MAG: molybdenum cofactor guanylyltransferase [Desulfovibrio sp. MES5]|uniref:molybdenum cofactor guanylyltransferase n=1 Tax=Desulfovibrio sp. MES5 TaxID=1899016 RepID=UPI000B9C8381|nr:molybdenum cofactor guanylyltransferase [Desulfovibrio sp. MES5]OXS30231.1 MAG: molybdenum cofactor guanylyltransferase [Desulfovibrio sp. MES5]